MMDVHVALWLPSRYVDEVEVLGVFHDEAKAQEACQRSDDEAAAANGAPAPLAWTDAQSRFNALDGADIMAAVPEGHYVVASASVR